jgi:hypothetical protein
MRWSTSLAVALALAAPLAACRQTVVLDVGDGGGAGSGGSFGGSFGGGFGGFGAGGSGASDAGPPSSFCAGGMTKFLGAAPETPDLIVALDRSSSMNTPLTGNQSRVDVALSNLYDVVQRYQTSVRFGYIGFPATAYSTCSSGQTCCADSNFMIPTSMGFQSFLNYTTCDVATPQCSRTADRPTDAALHSCRYFYSNYEQTVRNRFVLLITDGEPGCGSRSECSDANSEISALTGPPTSVETVVIGIGDAGASCLTMLALSGGGIHNPQNPPYYYHASSGLDLANFISAAVGDLAQTACTIDITSNLPSNSDRLGVFINGVPIMHGGGYDSWDYQGQDKTSIKLSGNACTEFLAAGASALRLVSCSMGPP